jgi:hypothetical protein
LSNDAASHSSEVHSNLVLSLDRQAFSVTVSPLSKADSKPGLKEKQQAGLQISGPLESFSQLCSAYTLE